MSDRCYEHGTDECLGCTYEAMSEKDALRDEVAALGAENERLREERDALRKQVSKTWRDDQIENEQLHTELERLREDYEGASKDCSNLALRLNDSEAEVERLREEAAQFGPDVAVHLLREALDRSILERDKLTSEVERLRAV